MSLSEAFHRRTVLDARAPTVSIGLPVYNGENYLEEALDSLLAQSFEDFELIISDNASTDRTSRICRAYAERDPRIRYSRLNRNIGGARNHNQVFEMARGKYFLWAAHDDVRACDYIEKCLRPLEADPELVICYTRTQYIGTEGETLPRGETDLNVGSADPVERFRELIRMDHQIDAELGLIRSSALSRTGLEGSFADSDRVLLAELGIHGRFVRLPEKLFFRRDHPMRHTRIGPRQERTWWFTPESPTRIVFPYFRQFFELNRAIGRAAPRWGVRLRGYRVMLGWLWTNRRWLVEDLRWGMVLTARRFGIRRRRGAKTRRD